MTALQQLNTNTDEVIDCMALVDILHDYFLNKGEIGKCPLLKQMKIQLSEMKQNQTTNQ